MLLNKKNIILINHSFIQQKKKYSSLGHKFCGLSRGRCWDENRIWGFKLSLTFLSDKSCKKNVRITLKNKGYALALFFLREKNITNAIAINNKRLPHTIAAITPPKNVRTEK